jgi:phosphomethylpyrimidine synthase
LAAHAVDIVKLGRKARRKDEEMASARARLRWDEQFKRCIDPEKARKIYERVPTKSKACTMCGDNCALLILRKYLKTKSKCF